MKNVWNVKPLGNKEFDIKSILLNKEFDIKVYCGCKDKLMEFESMGDDLMGNIREYYVCPNCKRKVYFIVATDED